MTKETDEIKDDAVFHLKVDCQGSDPGTGGALVLEQGQEPGDVRSGYAYSAWQRWIGIQVL